MNRIEMMLMGLMAAGAEFPVVSGLGVWAGLRLEARLERQEIAREEDRIATLNRRLGHGGSNAERTEVILRQIALSEEQVVAGRARLAALQKKMESATRLHNGLTLLSNPFSGNRFTRVTTA